jgi:hypothetical protein
MSGRQVTVLLNLNGWLWDISKTLKTICIPKIETYYEVQNRLDYIDGANLIANKAIEQIILNGAFLWIYFSEKTKEN